MPKLRSYLNLIHFQQTTLCWKLNQYHFFQSYNSLLKLTATSRCDKVAGLGLYHRQLLEFILISKSDIGGILSVYLRHRRRDGNIHVEVKKGAEPFRPPAEFGMCIASTPRRLWVKVNNWGWRYSPLSLRSHGARFNAPPSAQATPTRRQPLYLVVFQWLLGSQI